MAFVTKRRDLLVVAGELSGDLAAARVVEALGKKCRLDILAVGGDALQAQDVQMLAHTTSLSAMGVVDISKKASRWIETWALLRNQIEQQRPKVALLVDSPEINLPLARILKNSGTRVVYYIGPQVWAWRKRRLELLGKRTDIVALILPFEKEMYDAARVNAAFVGHPVLDEPRAADAALTRKKLGVPDTSSLVALLPGSRKGEIKRHSGPMIRAGAQLAHIGVKVVFAPPLGPISALSLSQARAAGIDTLDSSVHVRDLLAAADAALVASGTATLHAAVAGVPMAIVYRLDEVSWLAARLVLQMPYIGLPNWIAGSKIVPELLQDEVSSESLFDQALKLLDSRERARQKEAFSSVVRALGTPGTARRVAELVLERLS
jgi:lipid-A-disaccharide synthase